MGQTPHRRPTCRVLQNHPQRSKKNTREITFKLIHPPCWSPPKPRAEPRTESFESVGAETNFSYTAEPGPVSHQHSFTDTSLSQRNHKEKQGNTFGRLEKKKQEVKVDLECYLVLERDYELAEYLSSVRGQKLRPTLTRFRLRPTLTRYRIYEGLDEVQKRYVRNRIISLLKEVKNNSWTAEAFQLISPEETPLTRRSVADSAAIDLHESCDLPFSSERRRSNFTVNLEAVTLWSCELYCVTRRGLLMFSRLRLKRENVGTIAQHFGIFPFVPVEMLAELFGFPPLGVVNIVLWTNALDGWP